MLDEEQLDFLENDLKKYKDKDPIPYIEVGSSGGNLNGARIRGESFSDGIFYHWLWGHVKGSKVYLTVKEIDGPMGQGRMFRADDWNTEDGGPDFDIADPAVSIKPQT